MPGLFFLRWRAILILAFYSLGLHASGPTNNTILLEYNAANGQAPGKDDK